MEQCAFHKPQFTYILVTFLFMSNTHFQDCHTRVCRTFFFTSFSDVFLTNQARRLSIHVHYISLKELLLVCIGIIRVIQWVVSTLEVDVLKAVKNYLADISSVGPFASLKEQPIISSKRETLF